MYKTLHLAGDVLWKNKLLTLLLVLQLVFTMFFTLDYTCKAYSLIYPKQVMGGCTSTNFAYFSPIDYRAYSFQEGINMESTASPHADFDSLNGLISSENVYTAFDENAYLELRAYPKLLNEKLNIPMRKGKWLTEAQADSAGAINCVTSNAKREIGDIISFCDSESKTRLNLRVAGVAADPYFCFDQYAGGEMLALSNVVESTEKNELLVSGVEILWIDSVHLPPIIREQQPNTENRLLFFGDISKEEMQENIQILKKSGSVLTTESSFDLVRQSTMYKEDLPQVLCVWCISLVGFICAAVLVMRNSKSSFTVYSVCGASKRRNALIYFAAMLRVITLAVLPYAVILPVAGVFNLFSYTYSFISVGALALSVCWLLLAAVSAVLTILLFYGHTERKKNKKSFTEEQGHA